jgi:hypothetical protein
MAVMLALMHEYKTSVDAMPQTDLCEYLGYVDGSEQWVGQLTLRLVVVDFTLMYLFVDATFPFSLQIATHTNFLYSCRRHCSAD